MFNFYSPLVHSAHHFITGPLALNTNILQYGTTKDRLPQVALMDRLLTVLGLCYDSLKESDRTPDNMARLSTCVTIVILKRCYVRSFIIDLALFSKCFKPIRL